MQSLLREYRAIWCRPPGFRRPWPGIPQPEDSLWLVWRLVVAADVGRKRDVADAVEDGIEIVDRVEAEEARTEVVALQDFGFEFGFSGG